MNIQSECATSLKFPTNPEFYYKYEMSPKHKVHFT